MISAVKSIFIWTLVALLILSWLPLLAIVKLFDRDPARYRTGRMFRILGMCITKVNPEWRISISGNVDIDDRTPYIVVSNHLSNADIPLISNLPWEMKWIAKVELFDVPVTGWMMKMAGDISVNRRDPRSQISTLKKAVNYLRNRCSVMFFPEGTRSRTGKLGKFNNGAFHLAIREQVPVLPIVIDGTRECLPKNSWKFGRAPEIKLKVLDPVSPDGFSRDEVDLLTDEVRSKILNQLAEWRQVDSSAVDASQNKDVKKKSKK